MGVDYTTKDEWKVAYHGDYTELCHTYAKDSLLKYGCKVHLGKKKITITVITGDLTNAYEVIRHKIQYNQNTLNATKILCEQIAEQQKGIFGPCYKALALTVNPHLKSSGIMLAVEPNGLPRLVFSNNSCKEYGYCRDYYIACINKIFDILKLNPKISDSKISSNAKHWDLELRFGSEVKDSKTNGRDTAQLLWNEMSPEEKENFLKKLSPEERAAVEKEIELEECYKTGFGK